MVQFLSVLTAVMVLFSASRGLAHDLWINCTDYYVSATSEGFADTRVYFGYGHAFPVDDFVEADRLASFDLISPNGTNKPLKALTGGFTAADVEFGMPGPHTIAAYTKPGYYTMYVDKGKVIHSREPMADKENIIASVYFENYAKCLVFVGDDGKDDTFRKPVGHNLEIVPLTDPQDLEVGDLFEFQVFFEGEPTRFAHVFGTYFGFSCSDDMAYSTGTGGDGKGAVRILHWGPQLLKAKIKRVPEGEHIGKCQNEKYAATLTFEVR